MYFTVPRTKFSSFFLVIFVPTDNIIKTVEDR